jgi:hypothetical protein
MIVFPDFSLVVIGKVTNSLFAFKIILSGTDAIEGSSELKLTGTSYVDVIGTPCLLRT